MEAIVRSNPVGQVFRRPLQTEANLLLDSGQSPVKRHITPSPDVQEMLQLPMPTTETVDDLDRI